MDFEDVHAYLEEECSFPLECGALIDRVGDARIDAPDGGEESLAAILDRTPASEYQSVEDAYLDVIGLASEAHIGRKHYDERGGARGISSERDAVSV